MRPFPALAALTLAAGLAAGCGEVADDVIRPQPTGCFIGAGDEPLHLTSEQTSNAATIAAVGQRDGMGERAVAVAVATAFQESGLSNVEYGHHDSLGLFQQRPSVGWGTEEEILDPVYASYKFYEKLRRTDGWQDMAIGDAAQAVQVSAYPELYEQWEDDAVAVAAVFAGGEPSGVTCIGEAVEDGDLDAEALAEAYTYQWGVETDSVDGPTVTVSVDDEAAAWSRASWAVAKAWEHSIESVEYGGMRWEPGEAGWAEPDGGNAEAAADGGATVVITLQGAT